MNRWMVIAITLFAVGCKEDDPSPIDDTVHLAGFLGTPDRTAVASYWRDGAYTPLTTDEVYAQVTSLCVDGSSVLMGGLKHVRPSPPMSVIWQDGIERVIEGAIGNPMIASADNQLFGVWHDATRWVYYKGGTSQPIVDTAHHYAPMAMDVRGDDLYICGYSSGPALPPTYAPPQHAQYWKNGELIFSEREVSNALSIFTHQEDVYMAGVIYPPEGLPAIACYWKNGLRVNLTTENGRAVARSVFVTDDHVYAAGMMNDQAVYWKDGDIIVLTTGTNSMANAVFVQGTDVHVAGYEHGKPAYWKNDIKVTIANQESPGQIKFVVVGSN